MHLHIHVSVTHKLGNLKYQNRKAIIVIFEKPIKH